MALRRWIRYAAVGASSSIGLSGIALYLDAPLGDDGDPSYAAKAAATRDRFPPIVYAPARWFMFVTGFAVSRFYLGTMNTFTSQNKEVLEKWVLSRPEKRALITVSNHTSTVDDPAVLAQLVSFSCLKPSVSRWTMCSQEYSYLKGRLIAALFYGSKTLPIRRGVGVNHPMLMEFFKKVQEGDWVHIFPEGKIVQSGHLGGREGPDAATIGLLKWGVGKLIARAEVTPVVLPIYHVGMERVMPQTREHKLISIIPRTGNHIHARVGEPIYLGDLLLEYKKERLQGIEVIRTV
jgi:monolysocardiolipin acyltransferase